MRVEPSQMGLVSPTTGFGEIPGAFLLHCNKKSANPKSALTLPC